MSFEVSAAQSNSSPAHAHQGAQNQTVGQYRARPPGTAQTVEDLREQVRLWRAQGLSVALVPSIEIPHAGLHPVIAQAAQRADRVIVCPALPLPPFAQVSVPGMVTSLGGDVTNAFLALLEGQPADLLYTPAAETLYGSGFTTKIKITGVADGLEAAHKPEFFTGVATAMGKVFLHALPDFVFMAQREYQQLLVIRRLILDLDLPVTVVGVDTPRDAEGLALSPAVENLSTEERKTARLLNRILLALAGSLKAGAPVSATLAAGSQMLKEAGFTAVDYLSLRDRDTLDPVEPLNRPARLMAAARIGSHRILDNVAVEP